MDKTQRVDQKNGVIFLVIMFNARVMIIKMSKTAQFLYFLLMTANIQSQYWQNNQVYLTDLIEFLHKMISLRDFKFTVCEILRVEISKLLSQHIWTKTLYFQGLIFSYWQLKIEEAVAFPEGSKIHLSDILKTFARTVTDFLLSSVENTKNYSPHQLLK